MTHMEVFEGFIGFLLSANSFDPRELKLDLEFHPDRLLICRAAFEWVLSNRPYTAQQWEDERETSFDENDELYAHLQAVYDYIFNDGPADFRL